MKNIKATVRYAKALIDLSIEQGALEKVCEDMKLIYNTCIHSKELSLLLVSPIIKTDKKQNILKELFKEKISNISELFILLITTKKRESLLKSIAKEFVEQYKKQKKILTAVITTTSELDDELRKKILELLSSSTHSEVEMIEKINATLIGGFVLQIGDNRIDASIAKQIRKLVMMFNKNPYISN
ncbi:MAG: ATP synthase F1 subunit delta [Bacteroidota bacterium]